MPRLGLFQPAADGSNVMIETYTEEAFREKFADQSTGKLSEYVRELEGFISTGESKLNELSEVLNRLRAHQYQLDTLRQENQTLKAKLKQDCSPTGDTAHRIDMDKICEAAQQKYEAAQQFHRDLRENVTRAKNNLGFAQQMLTEQQHIGSNGNSY